MVVLTLSAILCRGVTAEYLNYGLGPHICSHVAAVKSSFKKCPSPDFLETSV